MKLLLHTCCAPCTIYPMSVLKEMDMDVMGFFYRYNIHPFQECMKREAALREYSDTIGLKMIWQSGYEIENFLRTVAFREADRCRICYHERLNTTALFAKKGKFQAFSTTLLYSKFQNHHLIREIGESLAKKHGLEFFYHDFREGWKEGITASKAADMYRQQYCGCIFSEKERFYNDSGD